MSTIELKADLHARIDAFDKPQLSVVEQTLLRLELDPLNAQLEADFDAAQRSRKLEPEKVQAVIDGFRKKHPYR